MNKADDEKFKTFLKEYYERSDTAVIIYDVYSNKYIYANEKIEELFEVDRKKFLKIRHNVRLYSFVHTEDLYRLFKFQMIDDTGDAVYRIIGAKTKKIKWVHIRFFRKKIKQNLCVYAIIENIDDYVN
ncbi:MAG: hypothetical protein K9M56_06375 [Victivallales bacterium]|nr:hypothetical protein [Victivallales bacterium]